MAISRPVSITFKAGARLNGKGLDPVKCWEALEKVQAENGGEFCAAHVVKAARSKKSPLHRAFEWDDTEAAKEYRLFQAGTLRRSIDVRYATAPDIPARAFEVSRVQHEPKGKVVRYFSSTDEVMADPDKRAAVLTDALRQLQALRSRFRSLQELAVVWREVDAVLASVKVED